MATVSRGSIAVSGAVSAVSTANSATLYTAPASSYAIVQIGFTAPGGGSGLANLTIGGRNVGQVRSDAAGIIAPISLSSATPASASGSGSLGPFYVGPGQAVAFSGNTSNGSVVVSGVQFTNT